MDGYNIINIIATFAIAVALAIKWQEVSECVREGGLAIGSIILYYVVCAVSGLWSVNPEYSTFRAFEALAPFLLVLVLVRRLSSFLEAERIVLICMGVILLMLMIGARLRLGGFKTNSYSVVAGMLFLYSFAEFLSAQGRRRWLLAVAVVLGLGGCALGSSTGSNVSVLSALVVLLVLSPRHIRYCLILAPLLLLVSEWEPVFLFVGGGKSPEQIANFQNREGIWVASGNLFIERPLLGYGFAVASKVHLGSQTAHNAYLEALLNVGLLGAGMLFLGYAAIVRDFLRGVKARYTGSIGCLVAAVMCFINGMTVPTFGGTFGGQFIAFALILAMFTYHVKPFMGVWNGPFNAPIPRQFRIGGLV